ncbi:MAG: 16S rRNA (cytosine(1402)-N(4))-methyltransferase RsmH [Chloroflexi bacterium]|nr:16S rRNA (cytosine(1402)-N(4))-methyltransferase RsmH [Chloroflexota bacterium]
MPEHVPVLYQEVLEALEVRPGGAYIDATVGAGGHSAGILAAGSPDGRVLALDRDARAVETARTRLASFGDRVTVIHSSFSSLADTVSRYRFGPADGILFDLGLSSLQLADASRGFAFTLDGPLDMRFDRSEEGPTAAEMVNSLPVEELTDILQRYGEERQAWRIAKAIVAARPYRTTGDLVSTIEGAVRRRGHIHPATRTFQALRIAVNAELDALESALPQAVQVLAPAGRLVVISFHSLEDRIVKRFVRRESTDCICPIEAPMCVCDHRATLRTVTSRPIRPSEREVEANPRARSARMRVAERVGWSDATLREAG